jgi:hypothetical protein
MSITVNGVRINVETEPVPENEPNLQEYVDDQLLLTQSQYLNLAGGTLSGDLDMGNNRITTSAIPTNSDDVANKLYVDTAIIPQTQLDQKYLQLSGGILSGNVDIGSNKITSSAVPIGENDIINKSYIDNQQILSQSQSDFKYLSRSGGILTGNLDVGSFKITSSSIPTEIYDLTNKAYVDTSISSQAFLSLSGGTLSGDLDVGANKITSFSTPTEVSDMTNKFYVDQIITTRLPLSGGTMGGDINMGSNRVTSSSVPVNENDLTNKNYVDECNIACETIAEGKYLQLTGGVLTGDLDMGTHIVTSSAVPTEGHDLTNKTYVDSNMFSEAQSDIKYLQLAGGTLTGDLDVGPNKITSSAIPTASDDLTNKAYVDSNMFSEAQFDNKYLQLTGGSLTGNLDVGTNTITSSHIPTGGNDLTNKTYVESNYLQLTGGTLTGDLDVGTNTVTSSAVPTAGHDLTNKTYVDSNVFSEVQADIKYLQLTGGTLIGNLDMGTNTITSTATPTTGNDLTNKTYVDANMFSETQSDAKYLQLTGGTLIGNLDMGANTITSTATPTTGNDLTNKTYVDANMFSETQSDAKYNWRNNDRRYQSRNK